MRAEEEYLAKHAKLAQEEEKKSRGDAENAEIQRKDSMLRTSACSASPRDHLFVAELPTWRLSCRDKGPEALRALRAWRDISSLQPSAPFFSNASNAGRISSRMSWMAAGTRLL